MFNLYNAWGLYFTADYAMSTVVVSEVHVALGEAVLWAYNTCSI